MSAERDLERGVPLRLSRRASISLRAPRGQEALARLEYLVETGLRCGVVIGPKGAGKTTVLRAFAELSSTAPFVKAIVDVRGLDAAQALLRLGEGLGLTSHARGRLGVLWQEVADLLEGHRQLKRPPTIIFDHLDRARPGCQQAVERLLLHNRDSGAATFVLAFSGDSFPLVAKEWRQAADLRIEVAPLTAEETTLFLERLLSAVELPQDTFDSSGGREPLPPDARRAAQRGPPVRTLRVVGPARDRPSISADVVEAAMRELSLLRSSA